MPEKDAGSGEDVDDHVSVDSSTLIPEGRPAAWSGTSAATDVYLYWSTSQNSEEYKAVSHAKFFHMH